MFTVIAFYHFTRFSEPKKLQSGLSEECSSNNIRGTILLADEGINGTISGTNEAINKIIKYIRKLPNCNDITFKMSFASSLPFKRLKVRLKREIVTMGRPDVNPLTRTGRYVHPSDWDDFISNKDVVLIDTRNDYEVSIGTFKGAINPETKSFREFPQWWDNNKKAFSGKRIAMFCTGGIRCEKSTNYLLNQGEKDVFHLDGGILKYLETNPTEKSYWQGECFVFDNRVSVGRGLTEGRYNLCFACRKPIQPEDIKRPEYETGVSCHQCIKEYSENDRERFRERQKQISLAKERGNLHLGIPD